MNCQVPAHEGIDGNEKADELEEKRSKTSFLELEQATCTSLQCYKTSSKDVD